MKRIGKLKVPETWLWEETWEVFEEKNGLIQKVKRENLDLWMVWYERCQRPAIYTKGKK